MAEFQDNFSLPAGADYEPESDKNKNSYLYKIDYEQATLVKDLVEKIPKNTKKSRLRLSSSGYLLHYLNKRLKKPVYLEWSRYTFPIEEC